MGRELNVSSFDFKPYIDLDTNRGAEWSVMISFIEKYNFSLNLKINTDKWGDVYDNFTGTGTQSDVVTGEVDFGVGAFYPIEKRRFALDFTWSTLRNALTFLVPVPELSNGLIIILKPFELVPWLLLLLALILLAIGHNVANTFYHCYRGQDLEMKFYFMVFGVLLQQNMNLRIKFLGGLTLYFAMLIVAFYTSGLSSIMTKPPYEEPIRTGRDLNESDIPVMGLSISYISGLNEDVYGHIMDNYKLISPDDFGKLLDNTFYVALAIDHLDLGFALGAYQPVLNISRLEHFIILEEDLFSQFCCIIAYKNSVLLPMLNKHILRFQDSGLDYYGQAASFRDLNYQTHLLLQNANVYEPPVIQLQLRNLSAAFTILLLGHLLAILQFFTEISLCDVILNRIGRICYQNIK